MCDVVVQTNRDIQSILARKYLESGTGAVNRAGTISPIHASPYSYSLLIPMSGNLLPITLAMELFRCQVETVRSG